MPDYNAPNKLPSNFVQAAAPADPKKATVTIELDADVVAWFQKQQAQGGLPWQQDMNGVLRFYMESNESAFGRLEIEPEPDAAGVRHAAEQALIDRHADEYEIVHNGSGLSEEMPSDLEARHAVEWAEFERLHPEPAQPVPKQQAPQPG